LVKYSRPDKSLPLQLLIRFFCESALCLPFHIFTFAMGEVQQVRLQVPSSPQMGFNGLPEPRGSNPSISPTKRDSSPKSGADGFTDKPAFAKSRTEKVDIKHDWSPIRRRFWTVLHNPWFEAAISTIVFINIILIIIEADYEAQCFPNYFANLDACPFKSKSIMWIKVMNQILLTVYTCEAMMRIFVFRTKFPFSMWNQLDVVVIITGWLCEIIDGGINIAFFRIVRVARLARAIRVLVHIRELYLLLNGVVSSLKAIFFGTVLLMIMLVTYAIILLEWVHPQNSQITYSTCSECTTAFRSVWWATITLFKEVIAGDAWIISFPLIDKQPISAFIMIIIVVTVVLGMVNLILTVIVQRATEARDKDLADNVKQKQMAQQELKHDLLKICQEMDDDEDGQLSSEELRWAYEDSEAFRNIMMALDIRESDLESVFKILDTDGTGHLEYQEFCEELVQLQGQDLRVMIALTRFNVHEVRSQVERLNRRLRSVASGIEQNSVFLERQELWHSSLDAKLDGLMAQWQGNQIALANHSVTDLERSPEVSPETTGIDMHIESYGQRPTHMPKPPEVGEAEVIRNADEQVSTLVYLQKQIQNLALAEADVVHEGEKQVAILLSHVELATSLVDVLRQQSSLHGAWNVQMQPFISAEHLRMISSAVEEIQQTTSPQLVQATQTMNLRIHDARTALDRQEELFHRIKQLAPHDVLMTSSSCACTGIDVTHPISRM